MRLYEIKQEVISNPFPKSKLPQLLYHATNSNFDKFERAVHGIYASPWKDYVSHYGNKVHTFYANVKKMRKLNHRIPEEDAIIDYFFDRNYSAVAEYISNLSKQGYDCCFFGGDGDSVVLFNNIQIINAYTGKEM